MIENCLHGIAQLLVQERLLTHEHAIEHYKLALSNNLSLPYYLVTHNIIDSKTIASVTAKYFHLPIVDLNHFVIESIPVSLVHEDLIKRHHVMPLYKQDNQLFLAIDDPYKQTALKEIQFYSGLSISPLIVETNKLKKFIDKLLHRKENSDLSNYFLNEKELIHEDIEASSDDAPIVKFVNDILTTAIDKKVSDIHFEPYEQQYRIRYRQDGLLQEVASPPTKLATRIASRIKIMSNLDISEKRIPQDGRFKMKANQNQSIDIRVSTCPTLVGEKIVMRLLDSTLTQFDIETLGFTTLQKNQFLRAIHRPQGMILVTGPTGSGKTVTLYSALNHLNTLEKNICTVEDPVEIKMPGINQVHINPKAGLTFATVLRAFLRQDPDIIMVGEIRDLETAEIAIKAAQTGHLVLATLHTNNAAETLTRLVSMGIPSFNIASSVSLIVAQRLVRRLCEHCKGMSQACNQCSNGYQGRVGLFEVMSISKELAQLINSNGNTLTILQQAQAQGMVTMYQHGLEKVQSGCTTLDEVNRIIMDE